MSQALQFILTANDQASAKFKAVRAEVDAIGRSSALLRGTLGAIGPALVGAFSVSAITGFINRTVEGIDTLNDLKDATGASIENLSALEDVAARTGTSMETAGDAVIKLNKALNEAADPKSDAAAALKALGLSVKELQALDPVLALQKIGQALLGFADNGAKGRIELVLLGKATKQQAAFLKDLAEAGKLNSTVTTEQAAAAEKFRKELFALEKNATNLARSLAGPMVTAINDTIEAFRRGAKEGNGFFATLRDEQLKLLGLSGGDKRSQLQDYIEGIDKALANPGRTQDAERLMKRRAQLVEELKQLSPNLNSQAGAGRGFVNPEAVKPSLPDILDKGDKGDKTAAAKRAAEERRKLAEQAAQAVVDIEEQAAKDTADAWKFWEDQQLEASKARTDALKLQWQQVFDFIDQEQEQAIEDGKAFLDIGRDAKDVGQEIGLVFASAAGEAVANFQDLRGILKGILADIAQITIKETITRPLQDFLGSSLKGFSLASLFGSAAGNAFGPAGVIPFAAGGVVDRPTLFRFAKGTGLMGEAGPEAILPLKRGPNGKLGVQGGGGASMTFAPVIHIDSRSDRAQVGALVAQAVQQGQQQMLQYMQAQGVV